MQQLIDWVVSLQIPFLTEPVVRFFSHLVFAGIVAVAAPASLLVLTWLERKIIARIQDRLGPNRAGPFGWFQAIADMIKMFTKEDITPTNADRLTYNIAPGWLSYLRLWFLRSFPLLPALLGQS